ncbi:ATP-grasp domain-containing protein [Adlercreutzia murintestinalis]|uniref:ATP-grasp domain-containing protein n=1 Tax=Adlercreutzia murintestinalis TaxID=2941325 RepID=UPI00203A5607|nr:RimK family alpha-L-glutamate ligase [Adlercreutzia murintestinalis]
MSANVNAQADADAGAALTVCASARAVSPGATETGLVGGADAVWLVVNGFLHSPKFDDLYELLLAAAARCDMNLRMVRTTDLPYNRERLAALRPDRVLFWDKDMVLARMLESVGARLFNQASAVEWCDDKALTALALDAAGVPTPRTFVSPLAFAAPEEAHLGFASRAAAQLGYPLVVKEVHGSFGQQVMLVRSERQLLDAVARLGSTRFIMQEFIAESAGSDLRVAVVDGVVVGALLRESQNGDFRSNITAGGRGRSAEPTSDEAACALAACAALGLSFGGVDILRSARGPLVCEVNSNPHFRSMLDACGVNMAESIVELVGRA